MKTTKHQLIIHESSKETKTNSYCDLFLDCVGVKCISHNESCISFGFLFFQFGAYLMNVIPETCRFISTVENETIENK